MPYIVNSERAALGHAVYHDDPNCTALKRAKEEVINFDPSWGDKPCALCVSLHTVAQNVGNEDRLFLQVQQDHEHAPVPSSAGEEQTMLVYNLRRAVEAMSPEDIEQAQGRDFHHWGTFDLGTRLNA